MNNKVPVAEYDKNGKFVRVWESGTAMARHYGINNNSVLQAASTGYRIRATGGYARRAENGYPMNVGVRERKEYKYTPKRLATSGIYKYEREPFIDDTENMRINLDVIKSQKKAIFKMVESLGREKALRIIGMIGVIEDEAKLYGITAERYGGGEKKEIEICERKRK